jgi:uncharacterized membrane protein
MDDTVETNDRSDAITLGTAAVLAAWLCASSATTVIARPEGMAAWQAAVPAAIGIATLVLAYVGTQVWNPFTGDVDAETRNNDERYRRIDQRASRQTIKIAILVNVVGGIAFTITPLTVDLEFGTILVAEAVGLLLVSRFLSRTLLPRWSRD